MITNSKCGSFTLIGPLKGKGVWLGHARLFCKSLRCSHCRDKKLRELRSRIAQLSDELKLTKFASLTLDPKKLANPEHSDRYIRECWRKMRVLLQRKFGSSLSFIAVLEYQKSGMAHLHILLGVYIPQQWLSQAWQSIGGGKIVDIRYVDVHRVSAYLATYLAGEKIRHTLALLPLRARIFTTSRGIQLRKKVKKGNWWIVRRSISFLEFISKNPTLHRYEPLGPDVSSLVYFESVLNAFSTNQKDAFTILRKIIAANQTVRAGGCGKAGS